ncbi:SDR family oxidoreductase [Phototrophicus methaneseepsis]|uniref:SDR family oxidoreductase n=1 Tax=Phototrophicus methaneseepsis TaxID=2710758 RepID=A0A7S8ECQ6_9CHLR|nr:SDR family oxidoreductase [Phototrophicus methaneseepsis]QPC84557.1 SDR family oxidoreductase [Phototrophicus methaneseepsis]
MFSYRGKTALITGASSGIGAEFARALAARHMNLVLVARSTGRMNALATELQQQYGIQADVITADLSKEGIAQYILQEVQERQLNIDLLINNAAFGLFGRFETLSIEQEHQQMMVGVVAVVDLTHALLSQLLKNPAESAIINVASMAAFNPTPYMTVYGASKAFILSFSLALAEEYRQQGLHVLTLCPGATETAFFETSGEMAGSEEKRTPMQVVNTGLQALEAGQTFAVDGRRNRLMASLSNLLPDPFTARIMERMVRPHES